MSRPSPLPVLRKEPAPILACLDLSPRSGPVARMAALFAKQTGRPLVFFHAMEGDLPAHQLPDPLEWHLSRSRARRFLEDLAASVEDSPGTIEITIREGQWQTALAEQCAALDPDIVIIGSSRSGDSGHLSGALLERGAGGLLVVPSRDFSEPAGRMRVMVPLDGSRFADTALSRARAIARMAAGELLLAHVIPSAGIEEFGPPGIGDLELERQIDRRNERAACEFLEAALRRLQAEGISARSRCLKGDPRACLDRLMAEERPGLVVLSARGQGVKTCENMALGSTAAYLLDHASVPIMVVPSRAATWRGEMPATSGTEGAFSARIPLNRRPAAA
ncbi:universal stress protein [Erythrobacter sp.]|uniref:universal stress protein n=1 Tax=Erythrobacter sp. TaxID=1042 RepID=UPI001425FE6A|nr:universal stress protein [Erythrobacter sp.]QIQ85701.1 MAG: universal stress protein [Erythrobacter sp.]